MAQAHGDPANTASPPFTTRPLRERQKNTSARRAAYGPASQKLPHVPTPPLKIDLLMGEGLIRGRKLPQGTKLWNWDRVHTLPHPCPSRHCPQEAGGLVVVGSGSVTPCGLLGKAWPHVVTTEECGVWVLLLLNQDPVATARSQLPAGHRPHMWGVA